MRPVKRSVTHSRIRCSSPFGLTTNRSRFHAETRTSRSDQPTRRPLARAPLCTSPPVRAPPTYPFLAYSPVKERSKDTQAPAVRGPTGRLALNCALPSAQTEEGSRTAGPLQVPVRRGGAGCRPVGKGGQAAHVRFFSPGCPLPEPAPWPPNSANRTHRPPRPASIAREAQERQLAITGAPACRPPDKAA